jgi:ABC-type polysaccharide/polyol phosphate transport system ATPase subunit
MPTSVIQAERLGKRYHIGMLRARSTSLRDAIAGAATAPWRNLMRLRAMSRLPASERPDLMWALRDLSFEVKPGEVLGVIGGNGAGKSTLFKLLSRITPPTEGSAAIWGRVGSLLEVGTGFHPELTGRENIYLNGSILGMDSRYIERRFDEIVGFAGIGRFLDTPVKHYSSGMYLRLAFAVAAHLEPEVLLVDEVLAVGDAEFQRKCLGRMSDVAREGRTILFVSHNMNAIQRLCSRCLLLEKGRLALDGTPREVVAAYITRGVCEAGPATWIDLSAVSRSGSGHAKFVAISYSGLDPTAGFRPYPMGPLEVNLAVESDAARPVGSVAVTLYDEFGTKLLNGHTGLTGHTVTLQQGRNLIRTRIATVPLNPGVYVLGLWLADPIGEVFDHIASAFTIEVVDLQTGDLSLRARKEGIIPCQFEILEHQVPSQPVPLS